MTPLLTPLRNAFDRLVPRRIPLLLTEFRFGLFIFGLWIKTRLRGGKQDTSERWIPRRKVLRKMLRRRPYWLDGHLRLGFVELAIVEQHLSRTDPRALATIRLSGSAALQLLDSNGGPASSPRREIEAKYLLAAAAFHAKDYESAFRQLSLIANSTQLVHLGERRHVEILEMAGATALVVADRATAKSYFEAIPLTRRSAEAAAAIAMINTMPEVTPEPTNSRL